MDLLSFLPSSLLPLARLLLQLGVGYLVYAWVWSLISAAVFWSLSLITTRLPWGIFLTDIVGNGLYAVFVLLLTVSTPASAELPQWGIIAVGMAALYLPFSGALYDDYLTYLRGNPAASAVQTNLRLGILLMWFVLFSFLVSDSGLWIAHEMLPLLPPTLQLLSVPFVGVIVGAIGLILLVTSIMRSLFATIGLLEYLSARKEEK